MKLLVNILKAAGFVLGAYILLLAGTWALLTQHFGANGLVDVGFKEPSWSTVSPVYMLLPFALPLGALYLPPKGRRYAAAGALLLIVSILSYIGIAIARLPLR